MAQKGSGGAAFAVAGLFLAVAAVWGMSNCTSEALLRDGGLDGARACSTASDCRPIEVCRNHVCVPAGICMKKEDCKPDEDCMGGKCVPATDGGVEDGGGGSDGGSCMVKSDCGPGERCNPDNHGCEPAALIAWDPATLEFGAVPFGEEKKLSITVYNKGKADLNVTGFDVLNPDPDHPCFKISSGGTPVTLKQDAHTSVEIAYKQEDAKADIGTLQITSSDIDLPLAKVTLSSQYKGQPKLKIVDRKTLDLLYPKAGDPVTYPISFGVVNQGETVTRVATFRNGTAGDAILEFIELKETSTTDNKFNYAFYDDASSPSRKKLDLPIFMMTGDMVDLEVVFKPLIKTGADQTLLDLKTNDPDVNNSGSGGSTLTLNLNAQGARPKIEVTGPIVGGQINFGDWHLGNPLPLKKTVRVKNVGGSDLTIKPTSGLQYGGTAYTMNPSPLPDKIAPNAWVDVELSFKPTSVGQALNNLVLNSDDDANPAITIGLTGWGVNPTLTVLATPNKGIPSRMDFGNVYKGVLVSGTASVTNSGAGNLTVYKAPYLSSQSSLDYTLTNVKVNGSSAAFPLVLRDGGQDQLTFDIKLLPTFGGEDNAAAVIESNDVNNLNFNMQIHARSVYNNGDPCLDGAECSSGYCVNNICCNNGCSGDCIRCDVTGHKGVCTTVDSMCQPYVCDQGSGHCYTSCSQHSHCYGGKSCCGSGCYDHAPYDNDRWSAVYLGENCGMMKCWACAGHGGYRDWGSQLAGQRGKWYKVSVTNKFSVCGQNLGCWENYDVNNKVYLTAPAGITWQVCLYDEGSTSPSACQTANGGTVELLMSHSKNYLTSEQYTYYIEVKYVSGASCSDWIVKIEDVSC